MDLPVTSFFISGKKKKSGRIRLGEKRSVVYHMDELQGHQLLEGLG
jgi:hypothetical protein